MRILIINCYDNKDLEKFQHFQYLVMKYLTEQKELIDTENEFYVRNRNTIEDFLYEVESSFVKKEAAQKFDQLDVIFIIGDSHTRPWSTHMNKIIVFLRMCLRVKKLLFSSGFAMQALVFLSASNIEKPINLINQNGGKLSDLRDLNIQIQQSDMFLENTSGDLYVFNYETQEWIPKINVGLHLRSAAQEFQSIGKYIVKVPVYKPKQSNQFISKNKNTEGIVSIKTVYLQHWAFIDVEQRFLAPLKNKWDVHNFQFNNQEKKFICLAESDDGPIIIEYPSGLACMFEIEQKYPQTIAILKNFIQHAMYNIKVSNSKKPYNSIENYNKRYIKTSSLLDLLKQNSTLNQKKSTLELMKTRSNSGITSHNKMDKDNNNFSQPQAVNFGRRSSIAHVGFTLNKNVPIKPVEYNSVGKRRIKYNLHKKQINADNISKQPSSLDSNKEEIICELEQITKTETLKAPSRYQIRKMLHPDIPKYCLEDKKIWIPGHLSETNFDQSNSKKIKIQTQKLPINKCAQPDSEMQKISLLQ